MYRYDYFKNFEKASDFFSSTAKLLDDEQYNELKYLTLGFTTGYGRELQNEVNQREVYNYLDKMYNERITNKVRQITEGIDEIVYLIDSFVWQKDIASKRFTQELKNEISKNLNELIFALDEGSEQKNHKSTLDLNLYNVLVLPESNIEKHGIDVIEKLIDDTLIIIEEIKTVIEENIQ